MARRNVLTHSKKKRAQQLVQKNRLLEARELYRQICRVDRGDYDAWFKLGAIHGQLGEYLEAEACSRKVITLRPDFVEAYNNLGSSLELQDKYDEALQVFSKVLEANPGAARTAGAMARLYEKLGEINKAYNLISPFIRKGIGDVNVALTFARVSRHFDRGADVIAYISRVLREVSISEADRMRLQFNLGALYETEGEFDRAFEIFSEANKRKHACFDLHKHEQYIENIITTYNSGDVLSRMPHAENDSEIPVFIVGMPRSGTTLVEQILSSHSSVFGAGELADMPRVAESLASNDSAGVSTPLAFPEKLANGGAEQIAGHYLESLREQSGSAARVTDKMPLNFLHLGLIALLFPGTRIIHCVRHPLDTCLSSYCIDFLQGNYHAYNLADLGGFYLQYEKLMRHWKTVLDIPMMEVRYEELVHDQEQVSRSMIEFLGLQWEEQCLQFQESKRFAKTASYDQVRQPLYTKSIGRWKNYEHHLDPLIAALGKSIKP